MTLTRVNQQERRQFDQQQKSQHERSQAAGRAQEQRRATQHQSTKLAVFYERNDKRRDQFAVLALHVDDGSVTNLAADLDDLTRRMWEGQPLPFPVLLVDRQTASVYGIHAVPTLLFVDPERQFEGCAQAMKMHATARALSNLSIGSNSDEDIHADPHAILPIKGSPARNRNAEAASGWGCGLIASCRSRRYPAEYGAEIYHNGHPVDTAKVFMTGRSQAVRLPKAYRFNTNEVLIEKQADGAIVLRPKPQGRLGDRLWAILDGLPDDPTFVRPDQGAPEVRDWFDGPAPMPSGGVPRARRATGGAKGRKSASKR